MSFWSGERLAIELPSLLGAQFKNEAIKCASYELCVGDQAFVTRDDLIGDGPSSELTVMLQQSPPNDTIVIQPGQFAFLLTEETIEVPSNAIALISMKAKYKFRGLINVSGFHVDPGFKGKLVFSLYNAGPREIILNRGQKLFIIVYADLDRSSSGNFLYRGDAQGQTKIPSDLIQNIATGQVFSPMSLQREMHQIKDDLTEVRIRSRLIDGVVVASLSIFVSTIVAVGAALFSSDTAVATVGGWVRAALTKYDEQIKKEEPRMKSEVGVSDKKPNIGG